MPHTEPAAKVDDPGRPAELLAAARAELDETVDRRQAFVDARELRPDVHVDPCGVEAPARGCDGCKRLVGVEAELRLGVGGLDRFVRLGLDAGCQANENALDARVACPLDLVRSVEDDDRVGTGPVEERNRRQAGGRMSTPKAAWKRAL